MPAISGKIARVGMTAATPTSSTDQAATLAAGGINLTINATGRRRWAQESTNVTVFAGATAVASSDYSIDYAIGRVRFDSARSTSVTYTVDVPWLTVSYIGHTRAWTLDHTVTQHDVTSFSTGAAGASFRTFLPGLSEAEVTLSRFVVGGTTGGSTGPIFVDRAMLNSPFYLDLIVNATDQGRYACYGHISGIRTDEAVDAIAMEEVTFKPSGAIYYTT